MLRVCLHGYSDPHTLDQWGFVLSHWKPGMVYILGGPDDLNTNVSFLRNAKRVKTASQLPKTPKLVLLSPKEARYIRGEVALDTFKHPADAIYMFGSNKVHLSDDEMGGRVPDYKVFIPTDDHHEMYDFVSAALVLYHRALQNG